MREKLIRDRIPERAAARGDVMPVRVADESEMMTRLLAKMHEELTELEGADSDSKRLEEFGDVVEVVLALGRELGVAGIYTAALKSTGSSAVSRSDTFCELLTNDKEKHE